MRARPHRPAPPAKRPPGLIGPPLLRSATNCRGHRRTGPGSAASVQVTVAAHRVVIVGGGFGGLYAARRLGRDPRLSVTLVDRRNYHLFQPLLYQVATGALAPSEIAQPLRSILRRNANTTVLLGEAVGIDPDRREVLLSDGGPIAVRHADRGDGGALLVLRPRRLGRDRTRPEVDRRRDRDPAADPDRVRGRRARARPRSGEPSG